MEPSSIPNSEPNADGPERAVSAPVKIVHITDAHASSLTATPYSALLGKRVLGYLSWHRKRRHQHSLAVLEQTTNALLATEPDLVVITGDLIHIGLRAEMQQMRAWLSALSQQTQVLLVPGNHDLYRQDSQASYAATWGDLPIFGSPANASGQSNREAEAALRPCWPVVVDLAGVRVIGLCSAYAAPWRKADGRIGDTQLAVLEQALRAAPDSRTVIALHHPVTPTGVSPRKSLQDAAALRDLLLDHQVSAVLHGHLHDNLEYQVGDTLCLCTAPASSTYATPTPQGSNNTTLASGAPGRPHEPSPAVFRTLDINAQDGSISTALHATT